MRAAHVTDSTKRVKDYLLSLAETRPRSQHVLCYHTNFIREQNHKTMLAPFGPGD
jgi:hypothetical protein